MWCDDCVFTVGSDGRKRRYLCLVDGGKRDLFVSTIDTEIFFWYRGFWSHVRAIDPPLWLFILRIILGALFGWTVGEFYRFK